MTEHTAQATVCAQCETMIRASAEQSQEPESMIPWVCVENSSVTLAFSREYKIVTWNTLGPLTAEAAKAAVMRMLEDAQRLKMPPQKLKPGH
jgi:hypothetical protein